MAPAGKTDKKAAVDAAAWMFNVVTSVGIIIVNKALMATYGFGFGFSPFINSVSPFINSEVCQCLSKEVGLRRLVVGLLQRSYLLHVCCSFVAVLLLINCCVVDRLLPFYFCFAVARLLLFCSCYLLLFSRNRGCLHPEFSDCADFKWHLLLVSFQFPICIGAIWSINVFCL